MKRTVLVIVCALAFGATGLAEDSGAKAALARLALLAGEWSGTYQWTGARNDNGKMDARYYVSGHGNSVVEDLMQEGTASMTSVYHLDGNDLRMTHFCAAGNQPRLKAKQIEAQKGLIVFDFVDATNLRTLDDPHVHGMELQMVDKDHLLITFLFSSAGKESRERITLVRKI